MTVGIVKRYRAVGKSKYDKKVLKRIQLVAENYNHATQVARDYDPSLQWEVYPVGRTQQPLIGELRTKEVNEDA